MSYLVQFPREKLAYAADDINKVFIDNRSGVYIHLKSNNGKLHIVISDEIIDDLRKDMLEIFE